MSDDERLLSALGEAAREGDPLIDPRWEALSAGQLSATEEEALAALAKEGGHSEELIDALRPLDEKAEDRIVERLMGGMEAQTHIAPREPRATVPRSRSRARPLHVAMTAMVAAAAVIAWFFLQPPDLLPGYAMEVGGGERLVRSGDEPPREIERFGAGSHLEITIHPAEPASGKVEARAFLVRDGRARALEAPIEIARGGAVRIVGATDVVFAGVAPGRWEIVVAVGRPGKLPDEATVVVAEAPGKAPFRLLRREILLEAAAGTQGR